MHSKQSFDDGMEAAGVAVSNIDIGNNWVVKEQPVYTPRRLKTVCVGAGFAGLTLAYKVKHEMKIEDFMDLTIYEKNHDVGGTWYENRYPGVACDVPAHVYAFPWAPNPEYDSFYASGQQIFDYFKRVTKQYNLDGNIQFDTKVVDSSWDEIINKWSIKIEYAGAVHDVEADILINASGFVNQWVLPKIGGIDSFEGTILHSANWDSSYDWAGKKVAVIGNGSSGIQIVPQIQKTAARVVNYARERTWISTGFGAELTPEGKNFAYTEAQKEEFRKHPETLRKLQKQLEHGMNSLFLAMIADTPANDGLQKHVRHHMETLLDNDPVLMAKMIPQYKAGCRRLTPGDGYLEALQAPNASLSYSPIKAIKPTGIQTAEGEESFDLIICATGFTLGIFPAWPVRGLKSHVLGSDRITKQPEAYFGICHPNMPNYFSFVGPNSPVGHGSFAHALSWIASYILRWSEKIAREDIANIVVKQKPVDDYSNYSHEVLKRTVWAHKCRSWYKNGDPEGKVTALYAGSLLHFKAMIDSLRGEDFDISYNSKNSFSFMGNGLTVRDEEMDNLAYYMDEYDPVESM